MKRRLRALVSNLPGYVRVFGWRGTFDFARIRYGGGLAPRPLHLRGYRWPVLLRPESTDVITMREIFLAADYDFPLHTECATIIDAGANIGLSTVFFAHRHPAARILAIEPDAGNFELLRRNTCAYPRVTAIRAALWGHSGSIALLDPGRGEHGYITQEMDDPAAPVVTAMTVGDIMRAYGLDRVDLLKLDIEGAEKEVLESSGPWMQQVQCVIAELHERIKAGCELAFEQATHAMGPAVFRGKLVMRSRQRAN